MSKKSIIVIGVLLFLFSFAQEEVLDPSGIERIDYLETTVNNTSINAESKSEIIKACNELINIYSQLPFQKQIESARRIQNVVDKLNNKEVSLNLNTIIANANFEIGNYDNSIESYYKIYNLYSLNGSETQQAGALMMIGKNYYLLNKYMKAKDYFERALEKYKRSQHFTGIAEAMFSIAQILSHWGEYEHALTYNNEALNFWKEIDDIFQIASVNYCIGKIYLELGDLLRAKDCFEKSLNLFKETKNTREISIVTGHIGNIYIESKNYNKALEYFLQADLIGQQINDKSLRAETSFNLGKIYNLIGEYIKAIDFLRKAIKLNEEDDNLKALAENYVELGLVYYNLELLDQALFIYNKGLDFSLKTNYKYQTTLYYKNLSEIHSKLGNFEDAFLCYQLYIDGRDQIHSAESKLKTAELQAKYQLSVKEKENEALRHNEQLINAQIKNQYLIIALIVFALLCLLIVSIIFRKRYLSNKKLNIQLSLKNKKIEDQQQKVEHLNSDLQSANNAKDRFFSIIAHDLKNPFNSLMGLIDLMIEDYKTLDDEMKQEFLVQMKSSSDRIYSLLQNLLLWGRNQIGKTELQPKNVNLQEVANETIALNSAVARNKNIEISNNIIPKSIALADKNMISTVLNNLISNAIKFTPENGRIELHSFLKETTVELMVADSGVGIPKDKIDKLFRLDEKVQSDGTNKEKGTGLGLILCKEFVEKNKGRIWAESLEGSGSWFYFTLPLANEEQNQTEEFHVHSAEPSPTFT